MLGPHTLISRYTSWRRGSLAMAHRPREATTSFVLRFGDPDREIIRFAAETDCDLIVAAWGGSIYAGRAKVVQMLLEQAPCPLLFVPAAELPPSARITPAARR